MNMQAEIEMRKLHQIYAMYTEHQDALKDFMGVAWGDADTGKLTLQTEELLRKLLAMKQLSTMPAFSALERELQGCLKSLGLIKELHSDAMRKRHWEQIAKITGGSPTLKRSILSLDGPFELGMHRPTKLLCNEREAWTKVSRCLIPDRSRSGLAQLAQAAFYAQFILEL